jgi:hypothetical protein
MDDDDFDDDFDPRGHSMQELGNIVKGFIGAAGCPATATGSGVTPFGPVEGGWCRWIGLVGGTTMPHLRRQPNPRSIVPNQDFNAPGDLRAQFQTSRGAPFPFAVSAAWKLRGRFGK